MLKKVGYKTKILLYFIIIVLTIVISLSGINYLNSRKLMTDSARQQAADTLAQLKNTNDLLLENMEQSLKAFTSYSDLEFFGIRYDTIRDYRIKKAVFDRISDVLNMNTFFTSCYVYYPEQKTVIDVNVYTPNYKSIYENSNQKLIDAAYAAHLAGGGEQSPLYSIVKTGGETEWVMCVPVQCSSQIVKPPLLIVTVDSSYFFQNLKNISLLADSQVYISNKHSNWIGSDSPPKEVVERFLKSARTSLKGNFIQTMNHTKYMTTYEVSQVSGWNYLYIVPLDTIYYKINFLLVTALFAALLCGIVGFAIAMILAGKIYTPIEALSGELSVVKDAMPPQGDAFNNLRTGVTALISQNKLMQQKLTESELIVKNAFLRQLLENQVELYESLYESFESYNILFTDKIRYMVATLAVEQSITSMPTYANRKEALMLLIQIEQFLQNRTQMKNDIFFESVNMDTNEVTIIFGLNNSSISERQVSSLLSLVRQDVENSHHHAVTVGYSHISQDVAQIPYLYQQAQAALEYQFVLGTSRIISFGDLPENVAKNYRYPWNIEKIILSNLKQGLHHDVCTEIDHFAHYALLNIQDTEKIRLSFINLYTDIMQTAEETSPDNLNNIVTDTVYQGILQSNCWADVVKLLKEYCCQLCEKINQKRNDHTNDIALSAIEFINDSFISPDLDLEVLSQKLNFSVSYISKMFKLSTGVSVKEYITQKRIALACELLTNTNKKVWEISKQVGYVQQRSFIEIFKKYKGMTPSEFRNK